MPASLKLLFSKTFLRAPPGALVNDVTGGELEGSRVHDDTYSQWNVQRRTLCCYFAYVRLFPVRSLEWVLALVDMSL